MTSLVRCPACDTFVKPASLSAGACPFCPTSSASQRTGISGLVIAAAVAAMPACKDGTQAQTADPSSVPAEAEPAPPEPAPAPPPAPVYGGAPSEPPSPKPQPKESSPADAGVQGATKALPSQDVDVYGGAPSEPFPELQHEEADPDTPK